LLTDTGDNYLEVNIVLQNLATHACRSLTLDYH